MSVEVHSDEIHRVFQYKPFIPVKVFNHNLLFLITACPKRYIRVIASPVFHQLTMLMLLIYHMIKDLQKINIAYTNVKQCQ